MINLFDFDYNLLKEIKFSMALNQTNASATNQQFNATLKGKIAGLEETTKALTEELNFYHGEI